MRVKNLFSLGLCVITAAVLFNGCAVDEFARKYSPENVGRTLMNPFNGKNAESFKKDFSDSYLADKFIQFYDKKGYAFDYSTNNIQIKKQLVYFSENVYLRDAFAYVRNNAAETEVTKLYKTAVLDRGNIYREYKGSFNKRIISIMSGIQNLPEFNRKRMNYNKWDLVPLFAEYTPEGELVSIMMSSVEVGAAFDQVKNPNVQSEIEMNTIVQVGKSLNPIKYNVSIKDWMTT